MQCKRNPQVVEVPPRPTGGTAAGGSRNTRARCVLLLLTALWALPLAAADRIFERELAVRLEQQPGDHEVVRLQSPGGEFLSLFSATSRDSERGVIVLVHGPRDFPGSGGLIRQSRKQFPLWGWSVMSPQMPVVRSLDDPLRIQGLVEASVPRIRAALDWLGKKGHENIVLLGYGPGGLAAISFLTAAQADAVNRLVLVSLAPIAAGSNTDAVGASMAELKLPILDLFSSADERTRPGFSEQRLRQMKEKPGYRQVRIYAVAAGFDNAADIAVKRVFSWLTSDARPPQKQAPDPDPG